MCTSYNYVQMCRVCEDVMQLLLYRLYKFSTFKVNVDKFSTEVGRNILPRRDRKFKRQMQNFLKKFVCGGIVES